MSYWELTALTRRRTAVFVPSHVRWCRCRWCRSHPVERWQGLMSSVAPPRQPALRDYPLPTTRTNTHTFLRPPFLCWYLPFVYRSVLTRSISDSVKEPHKLSYLLWLKMVLRAVLYSLKTPSLAMTAKHDI